MDISNLQQVINDIIAWCKEHNINVRYNADTIVSSTLSMLFTESRTFLWSDATAISNDDIRYCKLVMDLKEIKEWSTVAPTAIDFLSNYFSCQGGTE